MPGVQRRKHWGECIHCMEPSTKSRYGTKLPPRSWLASFLGSGLLAFHGLTTIEVKEVRPSSCPGRSVVKSSRKGLVGVSRWCRCTKCDHENSAGELMRNDHCVYSILFTTNLFAL